MPEARVRAASARLSFTRVIKSGKVLTANAIEARYCLRDDGPPRLGIAASKRYARLATTRNAFKRQVREAFHDCRDALHGMDVIVRLRAPIDSRSRARNGEIRNLFAELCRERSST